MEMKTIVPEGEQLILSSLSPSGAQKRLALAVVVTLVIAFVITAGPLSAVQLPRIDAFIPAYAMAMFVIDLITAVLLFAQFSIQRSRSLLVLSNGYLYTSLILIPWMLTFPGVFTPAGLLGAGLQTTAWLYIFWHAGFPTFVIAYALLNDADPACRSWQGAVGAAILSSVVVTAVLVGAAAFAAITENAVLPRIMLDDIRLSTLWNYAAGSAVLLSMLALTLLWLRRRSVLDLSLMVVMCAYIIEICLISFPVPARYSVGWYAGRIFGVLSGSFVLLVLVYEITALYGQLLRAVLAQRREREARLITGDTVAATLAHEIRQPLSAMTTNADASLRLLNRATPDLDEAKQALQQIAADGHRAAAVIGSVRAIFKKEDRNGTSFDLNELIEQTLELEQTDLKMRRVLTQTEFQELPGIIGDRIHIQQVLLNLISNAMDSMADKDSPRLLRIRSEKLGRGGVMVSVADTGTGIAAQDVERIFNPLFTTKSDGMGMGLSICRSIVEAHGGRLWATANTPRGAIFQFTLRQDPS